MLARHNLEFLDSEQNFDPLSELKEVSDKNFKFTDRLRHECGIPGWMSKPLGALGHLNLNHWIWGKNVCFSILGKFLIHRFDPKEVSDEKKKFTNRPGHEFCVRSGF